MVVGKGERYTAVVCQQCIDGGVTLVAVQPEIRTRELARVEVKDAREMQQEVLAPFIRNLEAQAKALRIVAGNGVDEEFKRGRLEALENAIALLKEGRT